MAGRDIILKNKTEVEVRTIKRQEAGDLIKLLSHVHKDCDWTDFTANEFKEIKVRLVRKKIKEIEKAKRQIMWGVYYQKRLIGVCAVTRVSEREKHFHRATLFICILEEFRNKGLGSALIKMALDFASKVAYEQFETTVLDGNTPAFILCTAYGFKAMCRFARAYKNMRGGYQDGILLVKYLNNYEI